MRERRWGVLVSCVTLYVFCWMYLAEPNAQVPGSDGHYSWLYARSWVYDGDFDFTNDYRICGDPTDKNHDLGGGRPENPFYVGPAIYWAPTLWVVWHLHPPKPGSDQARFNACNGPLTKWTLFTGPVLGGLTVLFSYLLARRAVRDGPAALAAGLVGFGSPLVGYATMWPHYVHVYDAFSVSVFLWASVLAAERPRSILRWTISGILCGVCILQRPVSAAFCLVPMGLALAQLRAERWRLVLALLAFGAASFLFGALPQTALYHLLYGRWWLTPQGRYYLWLGHAHPWLALFAPKGGLFYNSPVAWLSVAGIPLALRARGTVRTVAVAGTLAMAAIVYVSSAALDWDGASAYGARRLTSFAPLLTVLAALPLDAARRWLGAKPRRWRRALAIGAFLSVALIGAGNSLGSPAGTTTIEEALTQERMYGGSLAAIGRGLDTHVGDLAVLPAEWVFAARYKLRPSWFREATEPWFVRDWRNLEFRTGIASAPDPRWEHHSRGFVEVEGGLRMKSKRATLVFASMWPKATSLRVLARADRPVKISFASGRWIGADVPWGEIAPAPNAPVDTRVPIPPEGFDSGLNEIVVRCDAAPDAEVVLTGLELFDEGVYPDPI